MYSSDVSDARQHIIDNFAWNIHDGGLLTISSTPPSSPMSNPFNFWQTPATVIFAVITISVLIVCRKKK